MAFLGRDRARQTFCVFKRYRFAGSSRDRGVHGGLLTGLVLYIAYDHAMNFIDAVVARSESVPAAIYWLVPRLCTLLSVWLIWLVAFRLVGNPLSATLESIAGAFRMRSETGSEQLSCS